MRKRSDRVIAWVALGSVLAALSGCASAERPNVYAYPQRGQSVEQQSRDTAECQAWAKQQSGFDPARDTAVGVGVGAAIGALGGAAAGAAIGAATGTGAGTGAAVGATVGGLGGAAGGGTYAYSRSKDGYDRAFAACMGARGYSVR
jgi:hypothetical protein